MSSEDSEAQICYACEEEITDGEWVIPLETYEATYFGDELTLNADETVETIIHAECLKDAVQ